MSTWRQTNKQTNKLQVKTELVSKSTKDCWTFAIEWQRHSKLSTKWHKVKILPGQHCQQSGPKGRTHGHLGLVPGGHGDPFSYDSRHLLVRSQHGRRAQSVDQQEAEARGHPQPELLPHDPGVNEKGSKSRFFLECHFWQIQGYYTALERTMFLGQPDDASLR